MNNKQRTEALKALCDINGLYPLVTLTSYSKTPYCSWGDNENQQSEVTSFGTRFEWTNKENETKKGAVTGHSLLTGSVSGIMVLDIDNKNGSSGSDSLVALCEELCINHEELFKTLVTKTPNGGYHLFFKYKEGLKNKAAYVEGIDIRTDGGLIVLPYTKLKDKQEYKVYKQESIKEMPLELFNYLKDKCEGEVNKKGEKSFKRKRAIPGDINELKNKRVHEGQGRNQDLMSFLGAMVKVPNMRHFNKLLEVGYAYTNSYHEPPLVDDEVVNTVNSALKYALPPFFNEKGKLIPVTLVQHIKENSNTVASSHRQYMYNEKGYYTEMQDIELWDLIFNKQGYIPSEYQSLGRFRELKEMLDIFTALPLNQDTSDLLNLENGMLDLNKFKLLPHGPQYYSFSQVPFSFNDKAIIKFKGSRFEQLITSSVEADAINLIQEMFGLALQNNPQKFQKCFILVGDGSNGKGVILRILAQLIGDDNISRVGIQKYNTKFENYTLENKKLNLDTDSSATRIEESENFKKAIAGETISVQRKGVDSVDIMPTHLHISAMNNLPSCADKSDGFYRRLIFINFPHRFGSNEDLKQGKCDKVGDKNLLDDILKNEMDIVLAWALDGLKRIRNNNYRHSVSSSSQALLNDYMAMTDSVRTFIEDMLTFEPGSPLLNSILKVAYENYCMREGLPVQSQIALTKGLKRAGGIDFKSGSKRGIKNFTWSSNPGSEPSEDEIKKLFQR